MPLHRFHLSHLLAAFVLLAGCSFSAQAQQTANAVKSGYVGSAACARCHAGIAKTFAQASMGHSLTAITPEFVKTLPVNLHGGTDYFDAKSGHHFEVHAENGKLYQTEYQIASDGKEIFRSTHEMGWIIGTGENGFGALLRRGDYLFQAPLSYYTRASEWNLSPGYQNGDYGFNRIILPGCIYCHSGRPQPVAGFAGKYDSTVLTQTSVGCENCHGPGAAHIDAMRSGKLGRGPDATIVNPARLSGQLADDICMSCHQVGDVRVLQPGKTYQDFRPGEPLAKTVSIFQIPPTRENPPQDDHVEHYYSMSLSKCFRATRGLPAEKQLRCISCHDPHVEPTNAEAPAYFNAKCLNCHTPKSCTAPIAERAATHPVKDNCIGCHMPQRDIRIISHTTATNHRIVARADEPFPDETFAQTTTAMPDLIELNAAGERGAKAAAPAALTRLQAYGELRTSKPQLASTFTADWLKILGELDTNDSENPLVQAALGHRDLENHQPAEAIAHLQHALRLDPLQTTAYVDLSEAQDQSGQAEEAIASAKRAVELDPFVAALQKTLVFRLINGKHYDEAEAAMEKYLANFPEDDFMRKMLAMAKQ